MVWYLGGFLVFKWRCRCDGLFLVWLSICLMLSQCMVSWWLLGCMWWFWGCMWIGWLVGVGEQMCVGGCLSYVHIWLLWEPVGVGCNRVAIGVLKYIEVHWIGWWQLYGCLVVLLLVFWRLNIYGWWSWWWCCWGCLWRLIWPNELPQLWFGSRLHKLVWLLAIVLLELVPKSQRWCLLGGVRYKLLILWGMLVFGIFFRVVLGQWGLVWIVCQCNVGNLEVSMCCRGGGLEPRPLRLPRCLRGFMPKSYVLRCVRMLVVLFKVLHMSLVRLLRFCLFFLCLVLRKYCIVCVSYSWFDDRV